MFRILKVLPNEKIKIEEYRTANAVFNTNEYGACEECCVLSEVIDPFKMLYENQQLQSNWNELKKWLEEKMSVYEYQEASNFYVVLNKMQELENRKV